MDWKFNLIEDSPGVREVLAGARGIAVLRGQHGTATLMAGIRLEIGWGYNQDCGTS